MSDSDQSVNTGSEITSVTAFFFNKIGSGGKRAPVHKTLFYFLWVV